MTKEAMGDGNIPKGLGSRLIGLAVETWWLARSTVEPVLIHQGFSNRAARELGVVDEYTYPERARFGRSRNLIRALRNLGSRKH